MPAALMCHIRGTSLFLVRTPISVTALPFLDGGYYKFSPQSGHLHIDKNFTWKM